MEKHQCKKGLWTAEEDKILMEYVSVHGRGRWSHIAKSTGLKRSGKSCRSRWMNYLCPAVKHGKFSEEEEQLIIRLHNLLGNRWSLIAGRVPGRTDSQVKNYWNTHLGKKLGKSSMVISSTTSLGDDSGRGGKSQDLVSSGNSTSILPSDDGCHRSVTERVGAENFRKGTIPSGPLYQTVTEFHLSSHWFPSDHSEPYATFLMEDLDKFSIDVPWDDF